MLLGMEDRNLLLLRKLASSFKSKWAKGAEPSNLFKWRSRNLSEGRERIIEGKKPVKRPDCGDGQNELPGREERRSSLKSEIFEQVRTPCSCRHWAAPVGSEVHWVRPDRMLPCLEGSVAVEELGIWKKLGGLTEKLGKEE
ncbi:hypothetical protein NE237_022331 [Protea cynaroides]|uniref:Uncharacterized protein n=1 Tax=Protea cynaroides TaxID=273540 RepID=A0A9Q0H9I6_9MAGN|nr:hypothetical protein NE237_022331 [Protea cynaroides]